MNNKIQAWYTCEYPTDDMGAYIDSNVTFKDVLDGLKSKMDIYTILGAGDSLVREKVFQKLCSILKCDYNYIYNIWMNGAA